MEFLRICKVRCKHCGSVLGREYQSPHEHGGPMEVCSCGKIGFDPGPIMWRATGKEEDREMILEVGQTDPDTQTNTNREGVTVWNAGNTK